MPGFIAMISVMVVVGVEMFFASKGAGHSHGGDYISVEDGQNTASHGSQNGNARPKYQRDKSVRRFHQGKIGPQDASAENILLEDTDNWAEEGDGYSKRASNHKRNTSVQEEDSDLDLDELDPQADSSLHVAAHGSQESEESYDGDDHARNQNAGSSLAEHQHQQKMLLQCLLLEAGILFHSVFIGMAVSVATGTSFIVLLVAISFHQTFEGLALGSRIAAITAFPRGSPKPWLMALAYGTTTPMGQAIGLLVHNLYDPYSQTGLLMVGVMNAISSGLLLFAGLVELLAEDFLSDHSYEVLKGQKRLQACASVLLGAFLMALVGAWA